MQLVLCNAVIQNQVGPLLQITAPFLLENSSWPIEEWLPGVPKAYNLSVLDSKKNNGFANNIKWSEPACLRKFLAAYSMCLEV